LNGAISRTFNKSGIDGYRADDVGRFFGFGKTQNERVSRA
jgi:hypothetical protein